jgi:O-antigen ligase
MVVSAIAATGAFASTSVVFGGFGNSSSVLVDYVNFIRAVAFGLNSNFLGFVTALAFTAVVSLILLTRQSLLLLLALLMLILQSALKTRTTLGLLVLGLVLAVAFHVGFQRSILLLAIGVVVATALSNSIDSIYRTALGVRSNFDLSDGDLIRAATVPLAVRVGIKYPLLGIGDGNFQAFDENSESIGIAVNTHNDYLRLFPEFGLPCLIALILMLALGVSTAVRSESAALVMPVLIVFLFILFGNHLGVLAVSGGFWVLLGVAASLQRIRPLGHATNGQAARFAT